jgi:hypothetical protein
MALGESAPLISVSRTLTGACMTESRWVRIGGAAGIAYVIITLTSPVFSGIGPKADGNAATYRDFFVAHQDGLALQGWIFGLAVPLLLMFAVAVRRVLNDAGGGYLGELFLVGTVIVGALVIVTMAMQITFAQAAVSLDAESVFVIGVHFVAVAIGLMGFTVGATAFAYASCVFRTGRLPRWTAYLAILALTVNVLGTAGVFVRTGPFALEGGVTAWAPAASLALWYLGTSIAIMRSPVSATL